MATNFRHKQASRRQAVWGIRICLKTKDNYSAGFISQSRNKFYKARVQNKFLAPAAASVALSTLAATDVAGK
jgi:hypothetical protein